MAKKIKYPILFALAFSILISLHGCTGPQPNSAYVKNGKAYGIVEGAFSYVFKNQNTYSAGVNLLARYNFLPDSDKWRPYLQGGFGVVVTNLGMNNFGTNFNFASNAAAGIQYFFNSENSVNLEWRYFHFSNAGLDSANRGLNMRNIFIGFSHIF